MNSLSILIDKAKQQKVLVIGDVIADGYLEGQISRISREAPVLVLEYQSEMIVPGGAGNVVHNVAALAGKAYIVGVVGPDSAGQKLTEIFQENQVVVDGLICDSSRSTITKTRIMAGGQATVRQQVVRIDREPKLPINDSVTENILKYLREILPEMKVVILSDYSSGCVTPEIARMAIDECRIRKIPCIVDSRSNILQFNGVTVVKQNEAEAAAALGVQSIDDQNVSWAGEQLRSRLSAEAVLITRGPQGMTLCEVDAITHIPVANVSEVFDVSGAGDTVVAVMALALADGASYRDAALLANVAAGVVVRKFGTATTDPQELKEALVQYFTGGAL